MHASFRAIMLIAGLALAVAPSAQAGTLDRLRDSGEVRVGYRTDLPPFSSGVIDRDPEGFSIDLCRRVFERIREREGWEALTVRFVPVTAGERLTAIEEGRIDIECGGTTVTLSRLERVDFSSLFYASGTSFLSARPGAIDALDDLEGRSVAVLDDTTTRTVLRERLAAEGVAAKLVVVPDHATSMALLEGGEVDAVAGDRATLLALAAGSAALRAGNLSPLMLSFEPYAFPLPRNDADFRLAVNRSLAGIYRDGEVGRLWQKWFAELEAEPTRFLLFLYQLNALPE
ncbi:MAG: amino acid ABC transporter substrate-binding protein [Pseudomonadales bacterium]|jgi:ABC-type amino acid transport substrate-binding protein|nr:amino acid ABC transporter substrate-binding protein [Pseudomonadales bacterium]